MNKNILYLKINELVKNEVIEVKLDSRDFKYSEAVIKQGIDKYLNCECLKEYSTLQGRIEAIKIKFGFKYNVPIYINKDIILLKVNTNEGIYYLNILSIVEFEAYDDEVVITFMNEHKLNLRTSYRTFKLNYNKALEIIS